MKNTFTRNTFIFSILFAFAISFTSCSEDTTAYKKEIETADSFFKKQQYNEAKTYYLKAAKLNKGETYPTNQIAKINTLLSEIKEKKVKPDTEVKVTKVVATKTKIQNPFIVVIASYAIESNAKAHEKKLNNKGYKISIVKSSAGNFLVSLDAFNTLTKSYNYLESLDISEDYDINEAWVYEIK